jgi:hypothetical protein
MKNPFPKNPEPVPSASQLAVIPFLAAVNGLLNISHDVPGLRVTMHRTVNREGQIYLQQMCGYLKKGILDWEGKVGRTFPVSFGIMGAAFKDRHVWRTKKFSSLDTFKALLAKDIEETMSGDDADKVAASFLAVPLLGPSDEPVLILYADCDELNFFADDERVANVIAMGRGFCETFDWMQANPILNLRNFPHEPGDLGVGEPTVYASVQEPFTGISTPRFKSVVSFNYESAAA